MKLVGGPRFFGAQGQHPAQSAGAIILAVGVGIGCGFLSEGLCGEMDAGVAPDFVHFAEDPFNVFGGQSGREI